VVECSDTTPIVLEDLSWKNAPEIEVGDMMATQDGWFPVESVEPIAALEVIHLSVNGHSFAAGTNPDRLVFTHNADQKP
jgi:hypothetical protein